MTEIRYAPSLGVRLGVYRERQVIPQCVVIHTTGSGPAHRVNPDLDRTRRFAEWRSQHPGNRTPVAAAEWVYRYAMTPGPHVLIGQDGSRVRLCPDRLVAWHVGSRGAERYRGTTWRDECPWWVRRWSHLDSPRDLVGAQLWRAGSANALSLGIEVAPPAGSPTGPWSQAARDAVELSVREWCIAYSIPCTRHYILTHSDAHPLARTARGRPTDPGPEQWGGFDDWFRDLAGAPW